MKNASGKRSRRLTWEPATAGCRTGWPNAVTRRPRVDLLTNPLDGLGSHIQYDTPFIPLQADFNHLPFVGDQNDLVVFNASLHYSTRFETTLCEAWRI